MALINQNQQTKNGIPIPKRRYRQNYLAYSEPFDLDILLDTAYWNHKNSRLAHDHKEI